VRSCVSSQPRELARPVVVVGGYLDPLGPYWVSSRFKAYTGDQCFLPVTFFFCSSFDACRTKLIEAVDAAKVALGMLLGGAEHGSVYHYLEGHRRSR